MRFVFDAEIALRDVLSSTAASSGSVEDGVEPVLEWLGRLRMLLGVPFEYLVADDGLLRPETIRFFHLDRNWTDAAVDGALAAGAYGTRDRVALQQRHEAVRNAVDEAERHQRVGNEAVTGTAAANVAGFLLRSRAVSGWPGMHVRAWRDDRRLVILRMERLAPAVMLVLFDDIADRMEIEEPRQGIQFGVRAARNDEPAGSWWLDLRDPATGVEAAGRPKERVPFRRGSAGVLHLTELRRRLTTNHTGVVGSSLTSAELALQLLRYPYQQRFGEAEGGGGLLDVLDTAFGLDELRGWMEVDRG